MEKIPNDPNIMPVFGLFPGMGKVGKMLGRVVSFLPDTPLARGDHTFEKKPGQPVELPFPVIERPDAAQLSKTVRG